jgi:hypothetical protein
MVANLGLKVDYHRQLLLSEVLVYLVFQDFAEQQDLLVGMYKVLNCPHDGFCLFDNNRLEAILLLEMCEEELLHCLSSRLARHFSLSLFVGLLLCLKQFRDEFFKLLQSEDLRS